jgi:hypothetical protein
MAQIHQLLSVTWHPCGRHEAHGVAHRKGFYKNKGYEWKSMMAEHGN